MEVVDGEDTADSEGEVDEEGEVSGTWALDVVKGFLSAVVDGLTFVVVLFFEIMVDKIGTKFVMGIFLVIWVWDDKEEIEDGVWSNTEEDPGCWPARREREKQEGVKMKDSRFDSWKRKEIGAHEDEEEGHEQERKKKKKKK